MSENIKIFPDPIKFHIALEDGWAWQVGHKVNVCGIDFGFCVSDKERLEIIATHLDTGLKFTTLPLSQIYMFVGANKEETLKIFERRAEVIEKIIDHKGKDYITKKASKHKETYELKFGKIPPIELFDMEDVPEEIKEVLNESK
ncbi:hypothetical protein ABQD64_05375 [Vagococcus fluvialis]|uniref:hypothetical protein n=1 Tax=Vagococcus fluvialis TaxID=2738 RepID=UPI0032E50FAC